MNFQWLIVTRSNSINQCHRNTFPDVVAIAAGCYKTDTTCDALFGKISNSQVSYLEQQILRRPDHGEAAISAHFRVVVIT